MDRVRLKVNTTAGSGDSNAGKTYFISRPLQEICRFVDRLGSITSGSQFVWQECGNVVFATQARTPTYAHTYPRRTENHGKSWKPHGNSTNK